MSTTRRSLAILQIVLAACLVCGAAGDPEDAKRCRKDALDKWYCPTDPLGTAVVDELGRVLCAPGECAKVDEQGWMCSTVPGGKSAATPSGPVCDGECRAPETTACKKL